MHGGSGDGSLRVWDVETGLLRHTLTAGTVSPLAKSTNLWGGRLVRWLEWIPGSSQYLFVADDGPHVYLYDLKMGGLVQSFEVATEHQITRPTPTDPNAKCPPPSPGIRCLALSGDGNRVALRTYAGEIVMYDRGENERWLIIPRYPSGDEQEAQKKQDCHYGALHFLDGKGQRLVSEDLDGELRVWHLI